MRLLRPGCRILYLLLIYVVINPICLCEQRKNVLLLVADDLRPQLNAYVSETYPPYKSPKMHTPNIDNLASRSLLVERAYIQQALCGPSRASFLTSRRPDTTGVYKCTDYFRKTGGNFTTLPQYFKQNGYTTVGMGKVFHSKANPGGDDPLSWSEPYFHGVPNFEDSKYSWTGIPDEDLIDKPLLDSQTVDHAVKTLRQLAPDAKSGNKPFFMAVGFRRPHLPFVFPESFLKYYPSVSLPDNPHAPIKLPKQDWYTFGRIRNYKDTKGYHISGKMNARTLPDKKTIDLRRAYYSCVTWVDYLIGKVLSELDTLGLSNNTIVTLNADHGYSLGENGLWCKQTNLELATHVPLLIRIPGETDDGIRSRQLAELVDLFPTLVNAAGLKPLEQCPENSFDIKECTEGTSLLPMIKEPGKSVKDAAFSQYPRDGLMGYSIRTDSYRYTEWISVKGKTKQSPIPWSDPKAVELYDHEIDPEENVNRAYDSEYKSVRQLLSSRLHDGWRNAVVQTRKESSSTTLSRKSITSTHQTTEGTVNDKNTTDNDIVQKEDKSTLTTLNHKYMTSTGHSTAESEDSKVRSDNAIHLARGESTSTILNHKHYTNNHNNDEEIVYSKITNDDTDNMSAEKRNLKYDTEAFVFFILIFLLLVFTICQMFKRNRLLSFNNSRTFCFL